jgi:DNA polymerase III subunit delta'
MTEMFGHDAQWRQFSSALDGGKLHHGWILAGPRGLGKAAFALRAAAALVDPDSQYAGMIERGSHPDILQIKRLPKEAPKDDEEADPSAELKRSISIDQIRRLQGALNTRPGLANKRAVIIDAADDLERSGANALLKSLEEPPQGTYFLLVSHASDRLLPTIRSRCQMLRFEPLNNADMSTALREAAPEANNDDIKTLVEVGNGAPGQALEFLGLDLRKLEDAMASIIQTGDRSNAIRSSLADQLALKAAQPRFEAFLRRAPALIANRARAMPAADVQAAADAWQAASSLAGRAVALSLDKQSVVLQMGALLASLQPHKAAR